MEKEFQDYPTTPLEASLLKNIEWMKKRISELEKEIHDLRDENDRMREELGTY